MNMQGIKSFAHGLKKWTMKNSPVILAGLGVASLIGTAIAVAKGTVKATRIIDRETMKIVDTRSRMVGNWNKRELEIDGLIKVPDKKDPKHCEFRLPYKEMIKLTWKCYIPATIIAAGSIACIVGGTVQGQKRLAALSALYSMSEKALKEYQEKAKEVVGEKNAEKISDKVAEDRILTNKGQGFVRTDYGTTKVIDSWTGQRFLSDIDFIKRTVNEVNSAIVHGDSVSLNEWHAWLGIDPCMCGDEIGWDCDALIEISYRAKLDENDEPCIVLDYKERPKHLYR